MHLLIIDILVSVKQGDFLTNIRAPLLCTYDNLIVDRNGGLRGFRPSKSVLFLRHTPHIKNVCSSFDVEEDTAS